MLLLPVVDWIIWSLTMYGFAIILTVILYKTYKNTDWADKYYYNNKNLLFVRIIIPIFAVAGTILLIAGSILYLIK